MYVSKHWKAVYMCLRKYVNMIIQSNQEPIVEVSYTGNIVVMQ